MKGKIMPNFEKESVRWQSRVLTGEKAHLCPDWDYLPIDETTAEMRSCTCQFEHKAEAKD